MKVRDDNARISSASTGFFMQIVITGAAGFLGSALVRAAVRAGHSVRALVRPARAGQAFDWAGLPGVQLIPVELVQSPALAAALHGVDAVIHAAAAMRGDYAQQRADTVLPTEALLGVMRASGPKRLVLVSSFAVYDYARMAPGSLLDEHSPLEAQPSRRDAYAQVKLEQEMAAQRFAAEGGQVSLLRPGVIYGRGQLWPGSLGLSLGGSTWLRLGPSSPRPMIHVDNCAEALVAACVARASIGTALNLVDDELPTAAEFLARVARLPGQQRRIVGFPWPLLSLIASTLALMNRLAGGRLPLPGLLRAERLAARFMDLRFSNAQAKKILGWQPRLSLDEALRQSA